eukprot:TRINITY_DN871_c0_g1_i1.p1 TRINITY_DN871_c0_g1~~TRINITY_DN871_c0_g1_i1.p1  ORF type:complete len:603 (+),score=153.29 TRINITY_DN871_c0_g1_i1:48-1856(+)
MAEPGQHWRSMTPDQAVQISDNDMEWTFELPPVLKKKFQIMAQQMQQLAEAIARLETNLDRKVGKAEMVSALQVKVDRDEFEAQIALLKAELARLQKMFEDGLSSQDSKFQALLKALRDEMNAEFEKERAARAAELAALKAQLDAQADQLRLLKELNENAGRGNAELQSQVDELKTLLRATQKELETERTERQEQGQRHSTKIVSNEQALVKTQQSVDGLYDRMGNLETGLKQLDVRTREESDKLRTDLNDEIAHEALVHDDLKKLISRTAEDEAGKVMRALRGCETELRERLTTLSEEGERRYQSLNTRMDLTEDIARQVRSQVADVVEQMNDAAREALRLNNYIVRVDETTQELKLTTDQVKASVHKIGVDVDQVKSDVEEATANMNTQLHDMQEKLEAEMLEREILASRLEALEALDENLRLMELALQAEIENRIKGDNDVMGVIVPMRKTIYEQMAQKANIEDVRRALWLKVDKADIPVALSTRQALSENPMATNRCVNCDEMPEGQRCISCDMGHKMSAFPTSTGKRTPSPAHQPSAPKSARNIRPQSPRLPPAAPASAMAAMAGSGQITPRVTTPRLGPNAAERAWGRRTDWSVGL